MCFSFCFVNCGNDNQGDLKKDNDDDEQTISSKQNPGFFDCSTVSKKTDDKNKSSCCYQYVSKLFDNGGLCQFLQVFWLLYVISCDIVVGSSKKLGIEKGGEKKRCSGYTKVYLFNNESLIIALIYQTCRITYTLLTVFFIL